MHPSPGLAHFQAFAATDIFRCILKAINYWKLEVINYWKLEAINYWKLEAINYWKLEATDYWKLEVINYWKLEATDYWKLEATNYWGSEGLVILPHLYLQWWSGCGLLPGTGRGHLVWGTGGSRATHQTPADTPPSANHVKETEGGR